MSLTYQAVIRTYSASVRKGHADPDLTPRQRRMVHVLLNLASNAGIAQNVNYPPDDDARARVRKYLGDIVWDARPLVLAVTSGADADMNEIITNV